MAVDALPARQEAGKGARLDGLDLLAQRRQRGAPQAPQHLAVAPLAAAAAGSQLTLHEIAVAFERGEHGAAVDAVALAQLGVR